MPTQAEVEEWYTDRRNWARWGPDDQRGAINLITPDKRVAAATAVPNFEIGSGSNPSDDEEVASSSSRVPVKNEPRSQLLTLAAKVKQERKRG